MANDSSPQHKISHRPGVRRFKKRYAFRLQEPAASLSDAGVQSRASNIPNRRAKADDVVDHDNDCDDDDDGKEHHELETTKNPSKTLHPPTTPPAWPAGSLHEDPGGQPRAHLHEDPWTGSWAAFIGEYKGGGGHRVPYFGFLVVRILYYIVRVRNMGYYGPVAAGGGGVLGFQV